MSNGGCYPTLCYDRKVPRSVGWKVKSFAFLHGSIAELSSNQIKFREIIMLFSISTVPGVVNNYKMGGYTSCTLFYFHQIVTSTFGGQQQCGTAQAEKRLQHCCVFATVPSSSSSRRRHRVSSGPFDAHSTSQYQIADEVVRSDQIDEVEI